MSFMMNNHWWTNSPPSQSGRFWFNYEFTSRRSPFDPISANDFGWNAHVPLSGTFVDFDSKKEGLNEDRLFNSFPENIMIIGMKESESGKGIIIRVLEIAGKNTDFILQFLNRGFKNVNITTPIERIVKKLDIKNNSVVISVKPYGNTPPSMSQPWFFHSLYTLRRQLGRVYMRCLMRNFL